MCTEALAAYAARLDAVDISPEMLAIASARVPQEHVHFVESDIFGWRPARVYDVVFYSHGSHTCLHNASRPSGSSSGGA